MDKNKHQAISIERRLKLSFYSLLMSFVTIICAALIYYNYAMKQYEMSIIENNINYCSILSQSVSGDDYEYLFGRPFPGIKSSYYKLSLYFNNMMTYSTDVLDLVTIHKDMSRNSLDETIYTGLSGEKNPFSCLRLASYYFDLFIAEENGSLLVMDDNGRIHSNEYPFLFFDQEASLTWQKEKEEWVFYVQQQETFRVKKLEQDGSIRLTNTYEDILKPKTMIFYQYFFDENPLNLYFWWGIEDEPIYPPGQPYIGCEKEIQWIQNIMQKEDFLSGYTLFKDVEGQESIYAFVHVIKNGDQENVGLLKTTVSYDLLESYRRMLLKNLVIGSAAAAMFIGIINWLIYKYFVFDSIEKLMQGMFALLEDQKVDEEAKEKYDAYLFTDANKKIMDYMKELKTEVLKDPLTGAYNRKFLDVYMKNKLDAYKTGGSVQQESIFLLDLDYFKAVNDTYGHDMGDQVLKRLVDVLETLTRKEDCIIRIGGEEFILISQTPPEHIPAMLERIRGAVEEQIQIYYRPSGKNVNTTASVGSAPFPLYSDEPDLLNIQEQVHLVDLLMYRAKLNGRNGYSWLSIQRKPCNDEEKTAMLSTLEEGMRLGIYRVYDRKED